MKPLASLGRISPSSLNKPAWLDKKDRRMLFAVLALVLVLFVILAIFTPAQDQSKSTTPNSFLSGQHGAKAAFTLLEQTGYSIEHWEQPLYELAAHAGPDTVLIITEPYSASKEDRRAVTAILEKGGRVLATGFEGGILLPGNLVTLSKTTTPTFAACEAQPEGLQPLAGSGPIWIVPRFTWQINNGKGTGARAAYTCAGQPVVVEYSVGKGTAIWWASSTPLENGSIVRGQNMELLLNSIGPAPGRHIYWDESLHGQTHTPWDYTSGPVWPLLWSGAVVLALLVIFSYSRRSGPVRPLPQAPRTTPIEFLDALGSLYRSTGAAATAIQIAWERFRVQAALLTGQRNAHIEARELASAIERRFGAVGKSMAADLISVEEACSDEHLKPSRALELVQTLRRYEETLRTASTRTVVHSTATPGVTLAS